MSNSSKKIIYILGAGRSGTTLLDIVLGNGENMTSRGEINRFPKRNGYSPNCPTDSPNYCYWENIKNLLKERNPQFADLSVINRLHQKFEYHSGLIKSEVAGKDNKEYQLYASFLKELYALIFETTSQDIIVESSKYPGRILALSDILPYEIKVIYLMRDPVKVVNAFTKKNIEQPSKNYFAANLYYLSVNLLCKYASRKLKQRNIEVMKMKYEQLLANPLTVLTEVEQRLGVDLTQAKRKVCNGESLDIGYLFDGNRIRHQKYLLFNSKTEKNSYKPKDYFTNTINYLIYR